MRDLFQAALRELGVDRLVLGIQDASFPMRPAEDLGRGTPYSQGADDLLRFSHELGFTGLQLGPQGMTHRGSASPYEATLFTKNPLNLPAAKLGLAEPVAEAPRVDYRAVFARFEAVKDALWRRFQTHPELHPDVDAFIEEHRGWLIPDALYDVLCKEHGRAYWLDWGNERDQNLFAHPERVRELEARHRAEVRRHAVIQLLLAREHDDLRQRANARGLQLFADLQIGYSAHDAWTQRSLFLSDYRMGAPPSRTNPEGQPWGYFVLDPRKFGDAQSPGPVLEFVRQRVRRVLEDYDGLRVDHPHGWIDPWVYRADDPDPLRAVQSGARLRSTPADPSHPLLSELAIARADQLNLHAAPYADDRVRSLETRQVDGYAVLLDEIVALCRSRGIPADAMVCEILSTLPNPVRLCLERHGLGRFRVTQKAKLDDPADVYRSENSKPEDWIMLGNHDTPPIWRVVDGWKADGTLEQHAAYLSRQLDGDDSLRRKLTADPNLLVQAQFADALASPARNVYVFFTDLFGFRDIYNTPGTISDDNWSLRLPSNFAELYESRRQLLQVLDLRTALELALRTRHTTEAERLRKALASA